MVPASRGIVAPLTKKHIQIGHVGFTLHFLSMTGYACKVAAGVAEL